MKNKIFIFIGILIIIFSILFIKTDFFKNKSIPEAYNIDKKVYLEKKDSKYFYKGLVLNKDQSILLTAEGEKFSFGKDKEIILKIYGYPLIKRESYENKREKDLLINFSKKENFRDEKKPEGEFYIDSQMIKSAPQGEFFIVLTNLHENYYLENLFLEIVNKGEYPNASKISFKDGKTFEFIDLDVFKYDGNLKSYPIEIESKDLQKISEALEGGELLGEDQIYALAPEDGSYDLIFYGKKGNSYLHVFDPKPNSDGFYYYEFINEEDGRAYSLKLKKNLFNIIKDLVFEKYKIINNLDLQK